ncbi:MAG: DUF1343 domain-containing protein [Kiritimatiellae bacterium]|nr:DUF1343 domain-containing protein [Kiritimatiellia bacterium]
MPSTFAPGIVSLVHEHAGWLVGRRVGLVANAASVGPDGAPSGDLLLHERGITLRCLFAPEHGFSASAAAGEKVPDTRHASWPIPIFSLYGETRAPTKEMVAGLDAIVFDLPSLPTRCYTYISTLRYVMGVATEYGKMLVVADRPAPLPDVRDGPMLERPFESFVACVPFPLAYGMTPGEAALYLKRELGFDLDLRVAKMQGYAREPEWPAGMPWVPPSPGIRSWATAQTYPATVACEALPALDYGRGANWIFQVVGAPWMDGHRVREALASESLPGVFFEAFSWNAVTGLYTGEEVRGVRILVTDARAFRPVRTGVALLRVLQDLYGTDRIWADANIDHFDRLMGTGAVRAGLFAGNPAARIAATWEPGLAAFREKREAILLY